MAAARRAKQHKAAVSVCGDLHADKQSVRGIRAAKGRGRTRAGRSLEDARPAAAAPARGADPPRTAGIDPSVGRAGGPRHPCPALHREARPGPGETPPTGSEAAFHQGRGGPARAAQVEDRPRRVPDHRWQGSLGGQVRAVVADPVGPPTVGDGQRLRAVGPHLPDGGQQQPPRPAPTPRVGGSRRGAPGARLVPRGPKRNPRRAGARPVRRGCRQTRRALRAPSPNRRQGSLPPPPRREGRRGQHGYRRGALARRDRPAPELRRKSRSRCPRIWRTRQRRRAAPDATARYLAVQRCRRGVPSRRRASRRPPRANDPAA